MTRLPSSRRGFLFGAATSAQLFRWPSMLSNPADLSEGFEVSFFWSGTQVPATVFADPERTIPHASRLRVSAQAAPPPIYLDPMTSYRVDVKNGDGALIQTIDPYVGMTAAEIGFGPGATMADLRSADPGKGADLIPYRLPSRAGHDRTTRDKLAERVDVFDALTPAMRASVRSGDLAVDCSSAINAVLAFAAGGESSGNATGGTTLYFKGGRYLVSTTISNTSRYDKSIVDDGDLRRVNLEGDGSANTSLIYNGSSATPAYHVRGNNSEDGRYLYHVVRGIRFRRAFDSRNQGIGVSMRHVADAHFEDVHIDGFNLGFDAQDVLGFSSDRLCLRGNNAGLWARLNDWTRPNVWAMRGGHISGNHYNGARFTAASNVLLDSVRIEGNWLDRKSQAALHFENCPAEGGGWVAIRNCYFEGNDALYDVHFDNNSADSGTVLVESNSFNRSSSAHFCRHHLGFSSTGGGRICALVQANGFRSFNDYVPTARNQVFVVQSADVALTEIANLYEREAERPTKST